MEFPEGFKEKYEKLLGEEAEAFFASFKEEAKKGFRVNPLKETLPPNVEGKEKVSWSSTGYRGRVKGASPEHQAGYVYGQEPSAMFVAEVAAVKPGQKVLDLCAAPGGKSTQLAGMLQGEGILVANEIHQQRAKVLSENMERFGVSNVLVTSESPETLAHIFPGYFDMILVDAPCSGEGMFRKDPDAMDHWSLDYPLTCAVRQKNILDEAVKMLAPGGSLVYSTCTFAPEENEQIMSYAVHTYPQLALDSIPMEEGMVPGRPEWADGEPTLSKTVRLFPHLLEGEGHFVAKLKNTSESLSSSKAKDKAKDSSLKDDKRTKEQKRDWGAFWTDTFTEEPVGRKKLKKEQLFLLPEDMPDSSRLKTLRQGIHAGLFKKNRFEPNHALALALPFEMFQDSVDITEEEAQRYLHGETFQTGKDRGWLAVRTNGMTLGWGNEVKGTVKNFYPKGLRI